MSRIKTSHKIGGKKTAVKNLARDPDHYRRIGQIGGRNGSGIEYQKGGSRAAGFAADPERARILGSIGGKMSKRGPNKIKENLA